MTHGTGKIAQLQASPRAMRQAYAAGRANVVKRLCRPVQAFGGVAVQSSCRTSRFQALVAVRAVGTEGRSTDAAAASRDADYNHRMAQQMGWENADAYVYHYDRGIYAHAMPDFPNLMCGTMPRNTSDLDYLFFHQHIDTILNDFHYWNVDFHSIYHRCQHHQMEILRRPIVDFDPHSLRKVLPSAVRAVADALDAGKRVYVHCTAGLGRAPAVCIAHMYWFGARDLDDAYDHLTSIRPCGPRREAIRGATFDLMDDRHFEEFEELPEHAWASLNEQDRRMIKQRVTDWDR